MECQFPVQFLNAVIATPSLSDEVQTEVMKVSDPNRLGYSRELLLLLYVNLIIALALT